MRAPAPAPVGETMFQSLKRDRGGSCDVLGAVANIALRFNPSNGIGVVHAAITGITSTEWAMFQSLKRDRGGSCS